jgi:hypothetical protein
MSITASLALQLALAADPCSREHDTTRLETRERIRSACRDLGATADVCEALDVVVVRESSGRATVRHELGPNEHGRGATGLSVRLHAAKWAHDATEADLCTPEIAGVVVLRIWRTAVRTYGARTLLDLQRVFAGRWMDVGLPPIRGRDGDWCSRLARRELSCFDPVRARDLGRGPAVDAQDSWLADRLAEA